MKKSNNRAEELADRLDMPADICAQSAKITVNGRRHLMIENHRGIISYGSELIEIDCGAMKVNVRGDDLQLGAMDKNDMLISGRLLVIELE